MHGAHRASGEMLERPLPHILESAAGRPCGLVGVSPECPAAAAAATGRSGSGSGACQNAENACAANQGLERNCDSVFLAYVISCFFNSIIDFIRVFHAAVLNAFLSFAIL